MKTPKQSVVKLREFTEKVGPIVVNTPASSVLKCTRCKYLKLRLIRSGLDPQWEAECFHPEAMHHGYIGGEECETPSYCPVLKANRKDDKFRFNTCPRCYAPSDVCQCKYGGKA